MALEHYLREIRKYPGLGHEEERKVATLAKEGDLSNRELLIKSNLRLVVKIARKYSKNGISDELIQQGNQGLIHAVDGFNPDLGYRFSTYATPWVKHGIFSYFEEQEFIKLPPEQRELRKRIHKVITDYLGAHSEEPSHEQIAAELNKSSAKKYCGGDVEELLQKYESIKVSSLNKPLNEDTDDELVNVLEDVNGKNALEVMIDASTSDIVHEQIINLKTDDLTKTVLKEILYNHKSLGELSHNLRVEREKVKQIYERGMRLLKHNLRKNPQFVSSASQFQDIN